MPIGAPPSMMTIPVVNAHRITEAAPYEPWPRHLRNLQSLRRNSVVISLRQWIVRHFPPHGYAADRTGADVPPGSGYSARLRPSTTIWASSKASFRENEARSAPPQCANGWPASVATIRGRGSSSRRHDDEGIGSRNTGPSMSNCMTQGRLSHANG